jgi:hypothetical protein
VKTSDVTPPGARRKPRDESPVEKTVASPAIADTGTAQWQRLYRVGGAASLLAAGLEIVAALLGVIASSTVGPPPSTVIGWFTLLQQHRFVGLLDLGLFDIAAVTLLVPMFLAIYGALRRASPSVMAVAVTFGLLGIALYFASNQAFSMLSLSNQYTAATAAPERSQLLAAGQAMLAINNWGTGIYLSFLLVALAGLLSSVVMLRSTVFNGITAIMGIIASSFDLAFCLAFFLVPAQYTSLVGIILVPAAAPFLVVWHILIGVRLLQLARSLAAPALPR